jgi:6-phosphofructokinase 2
MKLSTTQSSLDKTMPQADVLTVTLNPAVDLVTSTNSVMANHKLRCSQALEHPGGGGVNVARVLHRFGVDVQALYPTGGVTGRWHKRLMEQENVRDVIVEISNETRQSFSVHETSTSRDYRFILPGPCLSQSELAMFVNAFTSNMPRKFVVISGGLAPGTPIDFYKDLIQLSKQNNLKVVLDSNGPCLNFALEQGVFLFKPSLSELCSLSPARLTNKDDYVKFCKQLINENKSEIIALSLAEQGAILVTRNNSWYAPPLAVDVKTTVGAGDSFVGAMIWSLIQDHSLKNAFAYGMAGGAAALLNSGTSLCHFEDVREFVKKVNLIEIS